MIPVKSEYLAWIYTSENENRIWLCSLLPSALDEAQGERVLVPLATSGLCLSGLLSLTDPYERTICSELKEAISNLCV